MRSTRRAGSGRTTQVWQLSIAIGVGLLAVVLFFTLTQDRAPAIAASPPHDPSGLRQTPVITLGVAAALTPPFDAVGRRQVNAVRLVISQTNAAGGVVIDGVSHTLVLVEADSACDATQAVIAANQLLGAGAVAVVGHTCSSASLTAQRLYNAAGVPMVSPSSSAVQLTEAGYTTTFRVYPREDAASARLATHFRQDLGIRTVGIVEPADSIIPPYIITAFVQVFTEQGGTITSRQTLEAIHHITDVITYPVPETPDAVLYVDSLAANAGLVSHVAGNLGLGVVGWLGGDVADLDDFAAAAGADAADSYIGLLGRTPDRMPGYDAFNAAYQAAGFRDFGDEAGTAGAFAYDAAGIIIAAIDRAGAVDPAAIAATTDYPGVVGTYRGFDTQGDVIPQWAWLEVFRDGEWVDQGLTLYLPLVLNNAP